MAESNPPTERQRLLNLTDDLLERLEQLHLADRRELTPRLELAVQEVGVRIGAETGDARIARRRPPLTVAAAHERVLAMQEPLLRGGERVEPATRSAPTRPPAVRHDPESMPMPTWLPRESREQWYERVTVTIQRAHDMARLYQGEADTTPGVLGQEHRRFAEALREHERYLASEARRVFPDLAPYVPQTVEVPAGGRLSVGRVAMDLDADQVLLDGRPVAVPPTSRAYAAILLANEGRFVTHAAMVQVVPDHHRLRAIDSIRVQVATLRRATDDALVISSTAGAYGVFREEQSTGAPGRGTEGRPSPGPARLDPESNREAWRRRPESPESSEQPRPPEKGPQRERGPDTS